LLSDCFGIILLYCHSLNLVEETSRDAKVKIDLVGSHINVDWTCPTCVPCTQMEPLIKESTTRLVEKISAAAENGETVEALQ